MNMIIILGLVSSAASLGARPFLLEGKLWTKLWLKERIGNYGKTVTE